MLIAVATLVVAGAAPAIAAPPSGVPGQGHGHAAEKPDKGMDDVMDEAPDMEAPPEWANAYGWRIKNAYGMTYGHLRICMVGNETARENLECPELSDDPEAPDFLGAMGEHGAGGFWVFLNPETDMAVIAG